MTVDLYPRSTVTGMTMSEMMLDGCDRGSCTCGHADVLVDGRRAEVQTKIEQLEAIRSIKHVTLDESGPC